MATLSCRRLGTVLIVAMALAVGNALVNPNRPAWSADALRPGEIYLGDVSWGTVLWLDARTRGEYVRGHIPNALLLNEDSWDDLLSEVLNVWEPGQRIVVYCGSQACQASHGVAERLRVEVGINEVYVLKGGWEIWQASQK